MDFDDNTNHGTCAICGICFYIPVGNLYYSTDADFLICDLDKATEELPVAVRGNESTQNPRSYKNVRKECKSATIGEGQGIGTGIQQPNDGGTSINDDGGWEPPPSPFTSLFTEIFDPKTPTPRDKKRRKRRRKSINPTEKTGPNGESKKGKKGLEKAKKAKEDWIRESKTPRLDASNNICQIQNQNQGIPPKLFQNHPKPNRQMTAMNQSPSLTCAMPSSPSPAVNTGYVSRNTQDGMTFQMKVRATKLFTQKTVTYSDAMFDRLKADVRESLNDDNLYSTTDCIQYIKNNTQFNGGSIVCIDLIKFTGINRHARFIEVFTSFMHILDICKEEDMNNTLDNVITAALANRPVAIILLTILGKDTFEHLLHINRDIGDSAKLLSEITTTCDIDEMFET